MRRGYSLVNENPKHSRGDDQQDAHRADDHRQNGLEDRGGLDAPDVDVGDDQGDDHRHGQPGGIDVKAGDGVQI